jgi:energy-coupling factor transporter ATP-binding protein EcfA2
VPGLQSTGRSHRTRCPLILDQPNSNLEEDDEKALAKAIAAARTVIVVTHRPQHLAHVDSIVVMAFGKVLVIPRAEVIAKMRGRSSIARTERADVMIPFATTSKVVRLVLALTALALVPLLAQALIAHGMLAQAPHQAVTRPVESGKPGATDRQKPEVSETDPDRTPLTKTEPPRVEFAPQMPILAPLAPEPTAPTASTEPASQSSVTSGSASVASAPKPAKPSITLTLVPRTPATATGLAQAPAAVATPAAIVRIPAAPTVIAHQVPARAQVATPTATKTKTWRDHVAKAPGTIRREQNATTRHPCGVRGRPSFDIGGATINAHMISQIIQRPEIQLLIARYGAR